MVFTVVGIVTAAPAKVDTVRDALKAFAKSTQDNEPETVKYVLYEQDNSAGDQEFVVMEEYTDKAGFEKHVGSSRFKELVKQAQEEELTSKPIEIKFLSEIGGFHKR